MKVKTILAFSQVPTQKRIWVVVCSPSKYPDGLDVIIECLGNKVNFFDPTIGWIQDDSHDLIYETYHHENPLQRYEKAIAEKCRRDLGKVVLIGSFPKEIPGSLADEVVYLQVQVNFFDSFELCRRKFEREFNENPGGFDQTVVGEIIPFLPGVPPGVWEDLIRDCPNLAVLKERLEQYLSGTRAKLPPNAFGFHQVWMPGLMAQISNLDRKREALEGLMIKPLSEVLGKHRKGETLFLNLDEIPGADTTAAELAAIYVNDYYDGFLVEVDLERLGSPSDLDFGRGSVLQKLLQGGIGGNRKIDAPVAVWVTGVKSRGEAKEVVRNLSVAFQVAVVFYNILHEEKIKKERSSKMNGNSIVESWRQSGEDLSYKIWKPVLVVGIIWLGLSFLLNIIGMEPAFVGDSFFKAIGRLARDGDPGTYFNLFVGAVMGFCMASAITALEIFGRTRMKDPFILLLLVIAYVSGLALNYAGIQGSYEAALKAGSASSTLGDIIRVIAAVATEFLPEQMIILAMEVGSKFSGASRNDREALTEQTRQTTTGQAKLVKVKVMSWEQKFTSMEPCSGPGCEKYTDNAVVTGIGSEEVVFAVCARCRAQAKANPNIMMEWDGVDVDKEKVPEEKES